jgi:c(7)-type cytochrome triheme protein
MRESNSQLESQSRERRRYSARRQWLSCAFLMLTMTGALLINVFGARAGREQQVVSSNIVSPDIASSDVAAALNSLPQDFSKFSHTNPSAHAEFSNPANCASCHEREGTQAQPKFPSHTACIKCHTVEFTTVDTPLCTICHVNDLGNPHPARKSFPGLRSFRVSFDHAQHINAGTNCASCHKTARRGVALSIPASLNAHTQCYVCHSPEKSASSLSSCGTCHSIGGYARTSDNARAFSFSFSHATHGARQRLGCTDCHTVRAGAPQSRQVASPATFQHFPRSRAQSCATCHNNGRAFGEADFGDCKKCHKGQTFRMGG